MEEKHAVPEPTAEEEARREFLARCGRFAAATPPAMALLASVTAIPDEAMASTIPGHGQNKPPKPPKPPKDKGLLDDLLQ